MLPKSWRHCICISYFFIFYASTYVVDFHFSVSNLFNYLSKKMLASFWTLSFTTKYFKHWPKVHEELILNLPVLARFGIVRTITLLFWTKHDDDWNVNKTYEVQIILANIEAIFPSPRIKTDNSFTLKIVTVILNRIHGRLWKPPQFTKKTILKIFYFVLHIIFLSKTYRRKDMHCINNCLITKNNK